MLPKKQNAEAATVIHCVLKKKKLELPHQDKQAHTHVCISRFDASCTRYPKENVRKMRGIFPSLIIIITALDPFSSELMGIESYILLLFLPSGVSLFSL